MQRTDYNGTITTYSYDDLNRLETITYPDSTTASYGYDELSRLTSATNEQGTVSLSYNNLGQLSSTTDVFNQVLSYSYEGNGNLTQKDDERGIWQYTWDAENRLTEVMPPDGLSVRYKYDALGRRVQRERQGGLTTNYIVDGQDVVKDINSDGSSREYLNGLGIDDKLRQVSSTGEVLYYVQDHLGSTRALTDATGDVVEQISYDSFGNSEGSAHTRYTYTGREWDGDAGLYYYRARFYDAQAGRFISEDPIGFGGGINFYAYVENSPTSYTDPLGMWIVAVFNRKEGRLFVIDVDGGTGDFIRTYTFEGLFSGRGECKNSLTCDTVNDIGPIPAGNYLIDNQKDSRFRDWRRNSYRLYRSQNSTNPWEGPFEDDFAPVTDPITGKTGSRGGFYIHAGSVSWGCVTFPAEQASGQPDYPSSKAFDALDKILQQTSPVEITNSRGEKQKFKGSLIVY